MRSLAVAALLVFAAPASAQKVLLIADDDAAGTATLANALTAAGLTVTQTNIPSYQYNGANPAPAGYDVIVLLAGGPGPNSSTIDMPAGGQTAIANFVAGGGGLVNTEWSALQVSAGRWQTLKPLVLLQRTTGTIGNIDYTVTQPFAAHPLWAGLPASFTFATATNVGVVIPGPGVVRVATSNLAGDAVALRDLQGAGRVVQLSTAGNYSPMTWTNANLQKLVANACKWASATRMNHPPVANAGGPYTVAEGSTITLQGACTDQDGDTLGYAWDYANAGNFLDATGQNPVFSAKNIAGPKTLTIAVKCTDTSNASSTATATVNVTNVAPAFTSTPPTSAVEASPYAYQATAADPGFGDVLTCALTAGPTGMTVTPACKVDWTPSYDQARAGTAKVTITVTDQAGASDTQSWTLSVAWLDADQDGLPDTWEKMYFGDLAQGPGGDPDMDGRPNLKELQDGTDPTVYDGPSAPAAVSPTGGARVNQLTATLTAQDAVEPHGEALTYEFAVYSDAQLMNLIDFALGVPSGNGATSYTTKALAEDTHVWWRVRARDPYVAGAWSPPATFFVDATHDPPTAPGISLPPDGSKTMANHPALVVTDATSPDELALTYEFAVFADANLTQPVESMAGVAEGMGSTTYMVATDLAAYGHFWWRARATDAMGLSGPWSPTASFQVFPSNPNPSPPAFGFPSDGARIDTWTPTFTFGGSVDLDGETITYQCDVDDSDTFDSPHKQSVSGLVPDGMDKQSWQPPLPLVENTRYCVRCRARDPSGASTWAQSCFLVDVHNDPPTVPTLQNPSMGGMAGGSVVIFTWVDAKDPEGDAIHYEVEVYADAALTAVAGKATGGDGAVGVTISGLAPGGYWWRARAVDALGAASDWSAPNQFTDAPIPGALANGGGGCGCAVGGRAPAPLALAVLLALLAIASLRRARARR